jgi:predicted RNA-binding protein
MNKKNKLLNEGLRPSDLQNLVRPMIEIDSYRSKMGEDRDVCVINFHVVDRMPARDLMEFIEKGFNSVLDADVSAGENSKGEYHVFVEFNRTPKLPEQIEELLYGVTKLTDIENWKFRYYKNDKVYEASESNLRSVVPLNPRLYEDTMRKFKIEEVKRFFSKTLMDDLDLTDNVITIHKPFNQKIKLRWLKEEDPQNIVEGAPALDETSTAEIFWMTKVLGDYEITKFGDKFLFTNGNRAMLLQRME